MNEITQRFLRTIAERVPPHSVSEVRLFPAIRQGPWETGVAVVAAVPELEPALHERHTVYTARYRLAVKGPDRGKWEFEIRADADAPLVTVDAVVAGVLERSGEAFEPERIPAAAFRSIVEGDIAHGGA
ncbi:MAG TPA: hypothetical protein VMM17_05415 [Gemmatimonadaceae bacterium]|nr:hypothetical protein [Gemmatimonadaceae bacterium]